MVKTNREGGLQNMAGKEKVEAVEAVEAAKVEAVKVETVEIVDQFSTQSMQRLAQDIKPFMALILSQILTGRNAFTGETIPESCRKDLADALISKVQNQAYKG